MFVVHFAEHHDVHNLGVFIVLNLSHKVKGEPPQLGL